MRTPSLAGISFYGRFSILWSFHIWYIAMGNNCYMFFVNFLFALLKSSCYELYYYLRFLLLIYCTAGVVIKEFFIVKSYFHNPGVTLQETLRWIRDWLAKGLTQSCDWPAKNLVIPHTTELNTIPNYTLSWNNIELHPILIHYRNKSYFNTLLN